MYLVAITLDSIARESWIGLRVLDRSTKDKDQLCKEPLSEVEMRGQVLLATLTAVNHTWQAEPALELRFGP